MSARNVRSVTKRMNKTRAFILSAALLLGFAATAMAQDADASSSKLDRLVAPLSGATQFILAEPALIDTRNATDCKLDQKAIKQKLQAALLAEKLSLMPDNAVARPDLVRLTLKPEIATLKDGVVNCVSWVALSAQTQNALKLAPNADRKSVEIVYWTRGALIMTPIIDHATGVDDVFSKLARVLARQWRIDNPSQNAADKNDTQPSATAPLENLKR